MTLSVFVTAQLLLAAYTVTMELISSRLIHCLLSLSCVRVSEIVGDVLLDRLTSYFAWSVRRSVHNTWAVNGPHLVPNYGHHNSPRTRIRTHVRMHRDL